MSRQASIFVHTIICMRKFSFLIILLFASFISRAGRISGIVTDNFGKPLPFSSISIKNSNRGTIANNEGRFFIDLVQGEYVIVCQHVGYRKEEKNITVTPEAQTVNFVLQLQEYSMKDVVIQKGEDPAYEIIRNTIKAKNKYVDELGSFSCEVYSKGILRLRNSPKRFMGQQVDFEDGDTSKKRILYLSESIAKYSYKKPDKRKIEVISTKVSGQTNGYGLSTPVNLNFYKNNVPIGSGLNPRGFISPIADGAFNYYKFKYEGAFAEDNLLINRIKVTPKRNFEPLFSGYINIIENSWRIHSVELVLLKTSQMQFLDTMRIEQLYAPVENVWAIKTQVFYPAVNIFGFDAYGSFLNVYSNYKIEPVFDKKYFDNVFLKYDTGSNKRTTEYWEGARPIPLQKDEARDYSVKDSMELVKKDPHYLDSVDRKNNKPSVQSAVLTGMSFNRRSKREIYAVDPILQWPSYNTAEGFVLNVGGSYNKHLSETGKQWLTIQPTLRYGFSNKHFNAHTYVRYSFGKKYFNQLEVGFGRRIFQFNNENPISPMLNTFYTLQQELNYMKIYEAGWGSLRMRKNIGDGFSISAGLEFQDRIPLENTSAAHWRNFPGREYTPNYPIELTNTAMARHQAFSVNLAIAYQPGARYIEFPDRKFSIGSKYPRFTFNYIKGIEGLFGSDVNYDKWGLTMTDDLNFKMAGKFSYKIGTGGFLNDKKVQIPDYVHFNGNLTSFAGDYLNTFQLASYYANSNTAGTYGILHAEHHFNGFLTNKIPYFKKLNWFLVGGVNAFYVNKNRNYVEVFGGLENILKVLRVDFIWAYHANISKPEYGVRTGFTRVINNQGGRK